MFLISLEVFCYNSEQRPNHCNYARGKGQENHVYIVLSFSPALFPHKQFLKVNHFEVVCHVSYDDCVEVWARHPIMF